MELTAKDLMIGDLVQIKDLQEPFVRITCTDAYKRTVDFKDEDGRILVTSETNIFPIPLTVGILERNGFKEYNSYGYAGNKGYCLEGFYINSDFTTRIANIDCKFNYVHELQIALRLCGIEKEIVI